MLQKTITQGQGYATIFIQVDSTLIAKNFLWEDRRKSAIFFIALLITEPEM